MSIINHLSLHYINNLKTTKMKKVVNKTEVAHLFANKSQNEVNNKFISVGCHKITIKEIKKLATNLGW